MKPIKVFFILIAILFSLSFISIFFPENGIPLFYGLKIDFPLPGDILLEEEQKLKDISTFLKLSEEIESDTSFSLAFLEPFSDSVENDSSLLLNDSSQLDSLIPIQHPFIKEKLAKENVDDSLRKFVQRIEYPKGDRTILYPFFKALTNLNQRKDLIRILHYGDSQIEGDRITSYIRNELQKKFGGSGIGLIPIVPTENTNISIKLSVSDNWSMYMIKDRNTIPDLHKQFGVLTGFGRFNGFNDSQLETNKIYDSWLNLKRQGVSYPLTRQYRLFRIFYGYNQKPFITQMVNNDTTLEAELIAPSTQLNVLEWQFDKTPDEFTLKFQGEDSPDVFAISLDNSWGVAVDNISIRGSSSPEFTKNNAEFFKTMFTKLNVKLVLLQFGVNVVPYIKKDYNFYENILLSQLLYLKKLNPNLSIIIIGVSDISRKVNGKYVSYPNIEMVRDAERRAAFRAKCGFWDMYSAMGGKNSMPSWVLAKPPLANKDFIHFSIKGSKVVAEMFLNSLMTEYEEYLLLNQTKE